MKLGLGIILALIGALAIACGSSDESGSGGEGGQNMHGEGGASATTTTTTTTTTATTSTTSSAGGSGDGGAGGGSSDPQAPVMKSVMPMSGALHVTWTNVTEDCDAVLVFRKQDDGEYALEYTMAGSANQKHDDEANVASSTYCYKAQCERGELVSPDSNEKCGSP
jgi:hypothetical protein